MLDELKNVFILCGKGPGSSPSSQGWNFLPLEMVERNGKAYLSFPKREGPEILFTSDPLEAKRVLTFVEDRMSVGRVRAQEGKP